MCYNITTKAASVVAKTGVTQMNQFNVNFTLLSDTHPNCWLQSVIEGELYEGELIIGYNCSPGDEEGSYEICMELQLSQNPRHWIQETIELNLSPSIESVTNMDITEN